MFVLVKLLIRKAIFLAENFISQTLREKNVREAGGAKEKIGDEESVKSRTKQMAYQSENESQNRNNAQKEMSDELHSCL